MNISIEIVVVGLVVIFIIGNLMGLKPKPHETRLGDFRFLARTLGLQPKFHTPDWLHNQKGLIQYTVINDEWRLALVHVVAKDGVWHTDTPHALSGQSIDLPSHLLPYIKGMMLKANSVSLYWHDETYIRSFGVQAKDISDASTQDLTTLKDYLTDIASLGH